MKIEYVCCAANAHASTVFYGNLYLVFICQTKASIFSANADTMDVCTNMAYLIQLILFIFVHFNLSACVSDFALAVVVFVRKR